MSRQPSSSSSSISSLAGPVFESGVQNSISRLPREDKYNSPFLTRFGNQAGSWEHSSWEIPYSELKIGKKIGRGVYGTVHLGTYGENKVAIGIADIPA
jgi:hypothetical protein